MNNFISKARFVTLGLAVVFLPFSVRFCHISLLIFMVFCLAEGDFVNKGRLIKQNPLMWVLSIFFLLHVAGVLYSNNISNAWVNVDKKIAFALVPLIIVSAKPFTKEELKWLMWLFVGACTVGSIVCLYDVIFSLHEEWNLGPREAFDALHPGASEWWLSLSYIYLGSGIGMHPTYLSLYLLVCILIVFRTVTNRWVSAALIFYFIVFIVFLSSRIIVLSTAFIVIGIAVANSRRSLMIACGVIMTITVFVNPIALYRNTQEYTLSNFSWPPSSLTDNPISIRMSLLWLSVQAVKEINPVIGTGTGDVNDTISGLQEKFNVHNVLETSDPHNQYLHTYIALGAIGLLSLLAVFFTPLWILFKQKEFLACAGLIAFMLVCLTESALELQKGIVLFTLVVSMIGNQVREWRLIFNNSTALTDCTNHTDKTFKSVRSV